MVKLLLGFDFQWLNLWSKYLLVLVFPMARICDPFYGVSLGWNLWFSYLLILIFPMIRTCDLGFGISHGWNLWSWLCVSRNRTYDLDTWKKNQNQPRTQNGPTLVLLQQKKRVENILWYKEGLRMKTLPEYGCHLRQ